MKTLQWIYMYQFNDGKPIMTLIERLSDYSLIVWGICHKENENTYQPVVRSPDRKTLRTILERLSLEDAKEAVEKKLFDDGVLFEGDVVEDTTE